jgi:hypothetical protein
MSRFLCSALFVVFAAASVVLPSAAIAGCGSCAAPVFNPCGSCYQPTVVPAQYRTVYDTVVVAPARVVARVVPARYGVVNETVMVSPPSQTWQSTCACGRESLQAVEVPAQYATVVRTVLVEPARVVREVIPAQYGTVARTELVSPAQTVWAPVGQY